MKWRISKDIYSIRSLNDLGEIERLPLSPNEREAFEVLRSWLQDDDLHFRTSGTSGTPKEIILSRALVKWSIQRTTAITGAQNEVLVAIPCNRVGGAMQVLRAFENDNTIMVTEPNSEPLGHLDEEHRFTLTSLVPFQLYRILTQPKELKKLRKFQCVLIGGEPLIPVREQEILNSMEGSSTQMIHTYGMTETASHIAVRKLGESVFRPFDGVQVSVKAGMIQLDIPDLDLYFRTGDGGAVLTDGTFTIQGRNAFTVNSAGRKIQLEELEHRLHELIGDPAPHPYALWKEQDEELGERLIMIRENDFEIPLEKLKSNLSRFDMPKKIYSVERILRNASGKTDRPATYASISRNPM